MAAGAVKKRSDEESVPSEIGTDEESINSNFIEMDEFKPEQVAPTPQTGVMFIPIDSSNRSVSATTVSASQHGIELEGPIVPSSSYAADPPSVIMDDRSIASRARSIRNGDDISTLDDGASVMEGSLATGSVRGGSVSGSVRGGSVGGTASVGGGSVSVGEGSQSGTIGSATAASVARDPSVAPTALETVAEADEASHAPSKGSI